MSGTQNYLCTSLYSLPLMKISLAINFPLCYLKHFQLFFLTHNEFLNIFNVFLTLTTLG